jgi:hypothetical protein
VTADRKYDDIAPMAVVGDNPITEEADDALGRAPVAKTLAAEIRAMDASAGAVLAVMGAWGSGKTSLVNLAKNELLAGPALPVIEFNPWMFSGAEQLVSAFFVELSAQLKLKHGRLADLAADVEAYGELLAPLSIVPLVGSWIERFRGAASAVRKFSEQRKQSVTARRAELAKKLAKLDAPIVVIIDDLDRLSTDEIRDMFKLVRLTANFPNVIYLLAFDRGRIEDALTETGIEGRSYLEKIVQTTFDVPAIPPMALRRQLGEALQESIGDVINEALFDQQRWPDILEEIILPLLRNMRDVRRYAASARITVRAMVNTVELSDLLALEAVRVFLPDFFAGIAMSRNALTDVSEPRYGPPRSSEAVSALVSSTVGPEDVAKAVITRLFPAAQRHLGGSHYGPDWLNSWLRERRVAHPDILNYYLEHVPGTGLTAFTDAERAFALLEDEGALDAFLRSINRERLEDVIAALEAYEGQYPPAGITPATVVLLNLWPELPERPRGVLDLIDARRVVVRVVLRLLRALTEESQREAAVDAALPRINTLAGKLELILTVGHEEGAGHKLVSEEMANRLKDDFAAAVGRADVNSLLKEPDALALLIAADRWAPGARAFQAHLSDPQLTARLLLDARTEVRSQSADSRAVRRSERLMWKTLVDVYGDEDALRAAIGSARPLAAENEELANVVALADRYLSGWRPRD